MYCVSCKKKTETSNIVKVQTKNNRYMLKGICVVCGKNKSSFVSNKTGAGFRLNSLINQLATDTLKKTYAYRSNSLSDNHLPEPE